MKLSIVLLFVFFSPFFWQGHSSEEMPQKKCSLAKSVVSLSASMTYLLERFGLLNDPQLKKVFSYHLSQSYLNQLRPNQVIKGGLFSSSKEFALEGKEGVDAVFYDQSFELEKKVKTYFPKSQSHILVTRNKDVLQITDESLTLLGPYISDCQMQVQKFKSWIKSQLKKLKTMKIPPSFIINLGDIDDYEKAKSHVMVGDGLAYLLSQHGGRTYKSDIQYFIPSSKARGRFHKKYPNAAMIGLIHDPVVECQITPKQSQKNQFNLRSRHALMPGPHTLALISCLPW